MAQAAQPQREPEWWRERREVVAVEAAGQPRDQVRWGPVWAGVVVTLATLVILSVLGAAIGLTAFETAEEVDTPALIWGAITALIAFFLGGLAAGTTAAVGGPISGTFNGVMVWATTVVLAVLLLALGGGAALGILGSFGITPEGQDVQALLGGLSEAGVWWTFVALAVGLIICAIGGMVGSPRRETGASRRVEE